MDVETLQYARTRLGRLREALRSQITEVEARLAELEPQLHGQGQAQDENIKYEYEYRQRELESGQRELELVEAVERELAGQGHGQPDIEGAASGASKQVKGSDKPKLSASACGSPAGLRAVAAYASGCPQAVLSCVAQGRAAASAPACEGPPHGGVGRPPAATADG
jgi:hypothetical protein